MSDGEISRLLREAAEGRSDALNEVVDLVYSDLQRLAAKQLRVRRNADGHEATLEPAALVNETYLKLLQQRNHFENRGQFFAIATRLMIRVLQDHHRGHKAERHGGGRVQVTLSGLRTEAAPQATIEVAALVEAMEELEQHDPRKADVLKLRAIWGLSAEQVARALGVSRATVDRDWQFCRSWLGARLSKGRP